MGLSMDEAKLWPWTDDGRSPSSGCESPNPSDQVLMDKVIFSDPHSNLRT